MFVDPQQSSDSDISKELLQSQDTIRLPEDIESVKKVAVYLYDYNELYDQYEFFVYGDSDKISGITRNITSNNCMRPSTSDASISDLEALILSGDALALTVKISYYDYNEPSGTSEYHMLGTEKAIKSHVASLRGSNCVQYAVSHTATGQPYRR